MKFKQAFNELKQPRLLLHYAIDTLAIYAIFTYILKLNIIPGTNTWFSLLVLYLAIALGDRTVHGFLGLV